MRKHPKEENLESVIIAYIATYRIIIN